MTFCWNPVAKSGRGGRSPHPGFCLGEVHAVMVSIQPKPVGRHNLTLTGWKRARKLVKCRWLHGVIHSISAHYHAKSQPSGSPLQEVAPYHWHSNENRSSDNLWRFGG
jgi:hypothetical protein